MVEWKEHGIWCQIEQVQFLYPPLPNCVLDKLLYLSEPQSVPLTNKGRSTEYQGELL